MVTWHAVTAATYYAADPASLSEEGLYFLTDTQELYRGSKPFTEAVVLYTGELPAQPARRKIYINTANGEGKVYTGTEWVTVIQAISSEIVTDGTAPVNSQAVIDYVTDAIADATSAGDLLANLEYEKGTATLKVSKSDGSSANLVLEGLGVSLNYDSATGALSLKDITGAVLGTAINLDLERFVKSGSYDAENGNIVLVFNDDQEPVSIPVGDLVDTYTAGNSGSIHMTVTGNQFVAEAVASAADGNVLEIKEDGLFVAACDLSNYMTLVADANTNALPMLNAQGQLVNGTHTLGGAALAAAPTATVLATELAVSTLVNSTKATLDASITALQTKVGELETAVAAAQAQADKGVADAAAAKTAADNAQAAADAAQKAADDEAARAEGVEAELDTAVKAAQAKADEAAAAAAAEKTRAEGVEAELRAAIEANDGDIATLQDEKLDAADVVAIDASAQTGQAADAKAAYDALTWKTTL